MSKIRDALAKAKRARAAGAGTMPEPVLGRLVTKSAAIRESAVRSQADSIDQALRQLDTAGAETAGGRDSERLVQVDAEALRAAGLLASESQERLIAEEYRQIKRPLLANANGRGGVNLHRANLIMVGSAMPNEGKTFTCINLALSISREKDWQVLLIDGDVANPNLTRLFGLAEEPGLLELVRKPDLGIADCIVPTTVPALSVMPAGKPHQDATELLGSMRMEAIAQRLAELQPPTIVLFDSPPLLLTTESLAIASHVGQTVVVVKAGHTAQQQVLQATAKLDPARPVSLILNQARVSDTLSYGAYYGAPYGANSATQEMR